MKRIYVITLLIFVVQVSIFSCKKKETIVTEDDKIELVFTSLEANKTTLVSDEEATITANVTGKDIVYNWETTGGTLIGSGSSIKFVGSACCSRENKISCTVNDAYGASQTKSLTIIVEE
ncbi:MAG: hypothetical protein ACLGGV_01500 [Bacteroidia bacterium]